MKYYKIWEDGRVSVTEHDNLPQSLLDDGWILDEGKLPIDANESKPYKQLANLDIVEDTETISIEATLRIITDYTDLVSNHIQARINMYNTAHKVAFGSVHNMAIYLQDVAYEHYQFAVDIVAWNKLVWESYRATMLSVEAGTIALPSDIISTLPLYAGVV